MNVFPYDTATGRLFRTVELEKALRTAYAMGDNLYFAETCPYAPSQPSQAQIGLIAPGSSVPIFSHPIFVEYPQQKEGGILFTDIRAFSREDRRNGGYKITNESEYSLQVGRAFLIECMKNEGASFLLNFSDLPLKVFSVWLASRINGQLNLSLEEQLTVKALAGWFHVCQYYSEDTFKGEDQKRAEARTMRSLNMDARAWEKVVGKDALPWAGTIDLFCSLVQERTNQSVRLEGLNRRFVAEVTGSTFKGAQTRELVTVALENPPSWIAIVERCVSDFSFYKKMPLGEIVERMTKTRDGRQQFLQALSRLPF